MFYTYLFATIVGGSLLLGSLLFGGHGDGDGEHGDGDGGHGDGDGGHGDAGHGDGQDHLGDGLASAIFSLRVWTYLLAFGGLTGLLLHGVAGTPEPLTAVLSAGVGLTSGLGARWAMTLASASGGEGTVASPALVGRTGILLLPCGPGQTGQVRLTVKGSTIDLLATTADPNGLRVGQEVLVIGANGGEARVVRAGDDAAPLPSLIPISPVPPENRPTTDDVAPKSGQEHA